MKNIELTEIIEKFSQSGWGLIGIPAVKWLENSESEEIRIELLNAIKSADIECGSCGCEFDPLYKKALVLLSE